MWTLSRMFPIFGVDSGRNQGLIIDKQFMSIVLEYRPFSGKNLFLNLVFSCTIAGIITTIDVFANSFQESLWQIIIGYFINAFYVFFGFIIFGYPIIIAIKKLNSFMPWNDMWIKRLLFEITMICLLSLLVAILVSYAFKLHLMSGGSEFVTISKYFTFSFIAALTFVMLIESLVFFHDREEAILKNEKLLRENLETRIKVIRNQINPHFLFNNLNVLSTLVYKDPAVADKFIIEFSKIYRYVLDMQSEKIVTVQKEIDFLKSYVYLLNHRFLQGLQVEYNLSEKLFNYGIPPLTLQLLTENVVKHNAISEENPVKINISSNGKKIIFSNNIRPRNEQTSSSGKGLKNIRERFKLLSDATPEITNNGKMFTVFIPLIHI